MNGNGHIDLDGMTHDDFTSADAGLDGGSKRESIRGRLKGLLKGLPGKALQRRWEHTETKDLCDGGLLSIPEEAYESALGHEIVLD